MDRNPSPAEEAECLRSGARQAIASSRLEGLEPTEAEVALMDRVSRGELTTAEAVAQALAPYRRR